MSFSDVWWESVPLPVLMGPNIDLQESMRFLSENPVLDEGFVSAHPDIQWDKRGLSRNPGLSEAFLQSLGLQKHPRVHQQLRLLEIDCD